MRRPCESETTHASYSMRRVHAARRVVVVWPARAPPTATDTRTEVGAGTGRTLPHLHRDWALPGPHLHRDWAHPCHICNGTGPAPATSAPGLGSPAGIAAAHAACRRHGRIVVAAPVTLYAERGTRACCRWYRGDLRWALLAPDERSSRGGVRVRAAYRAWPSGGRTGPF